MDDYTKSLVDLGLACNHEFQIIASEPDKENGVVTFVNKCSHCNETKPISEKELSSYHVELKHKAHKDYMDTQRKTLREQLIARFDWFNIPEDTWRMHVSISEHFVNSNSGGYHPKYVSANDLEIVVEGYTRYGGHRPERVEGRKTFHTGAKSFSIDKVVAAVKRVIDVRQAHEQERQRRSDARGLAEETLRRLKTKYNIDEYDPSFEWGEGYILMKISATVEKDSATLSKLECLIIKAIEFGLLKIKEVKNAEIQP